MGLSGFSPVTLENILMSFLIIRVILLRKRTEYKH